MKVEHVKGNTWVLIDWEYIPFYKVDEEHCILLDTGTHEQREDLENTLLDLGLTPVGILGSHAHIDHMGSFAYLQRKYGAKLALTRGAKLIRAVMLCVLTLLTVRLAVEWLA